MQFTREQLEVLCGIAVAAGREVMDVYGGPIDAWEKADASPLTQADLRADAVIRSGLEAAFPGVFILSEESVSIRQGATDVFFLVDPLDGTKEFLKRNGEFTVNIALVVQGEPVAGVVLAPALGELFYGARGLGAWKGAGAQATVLDVRNRVAQQPLRVIGSRTHGGDELARWLARLDSEHEFVAAGSSLKFCRIAEGQADIYPRLGPTSQWDTAAAHAVLQAAGGQVLDPDGHPLRYGIDLPVLNRYFVALGDARLRYPPLN